ncbi:hypothetical protein RB195_010699 [Necator americanus]|uniref:t-SNARE coiled-coil homology domain-containing protein n=1 Tax=Necator americanus TaxID=51031 RepID=A0ABR1CZ25_NECAM
MPIKDRLASLKRSNATKGEAQVMSELIIATEEEETTEQFLRRITSVREAITEMEAVANLIRQLHNLLKISNQTRDVDRARLRLLYEKLSQIIENFSKDLDRVVETVNGFYDEVRQTSDKKSAYYRMRKDQTASLKESVHSLILRFRNEEVPFEQETRPATEKHLREFNMKPNVGVGLETLQVPQGDGVDNDHDPSSRRLSRGVEISDVEKGNGAELMTANGITAPTLECTEIDEEDDKSAEKAALLEIKQRNEELQLLEEAVSKVNAMHEHLNFLVHTQNPIMDRIDTNISSAVEYTTKVMNDTKQAVDLSDEARQKQFLVFFLIGILIFMLVLMIITLIKVWVPGLQ